MKNQLNKFIVYFFSVALLLIFIPKSFSQVGITNLVIEKDTLLKLLNKYSFEKYYMEPNFPTKFLDKASKGYGFPEDDIMLAYIDASKIDNCKYGIVIGTKGLYINNSTTSSSPGKKFIPYSKFKNHDLMIANKNEFRIEFVGIEVFGLNNESKAKLEELLRQIKYWYLK